MSAMTDYLENKVLDFLLRGQAFVPPASYYFGLFTVAADDTGGETEVSGGNYARVQVLCSLANFSGTQGAGTTAVSNGISGASSNNTVIEWPIPSGDWGRIVGVGMFDSAIGGNLCFYGPLTNPKNVNNGDPAPKYNPGQFSLEIDN